MILRRPSPHLYSPSFCGIIPFKSRRLAMRAEGRMEGRALWKGVVRAGAIAFAVKLNSAVRSRRVGFHLLHAADNERLHQQLVCASEGVPVPAGEQVHGFEVGEGRYVLFETAELEELAESASRDISVHEFVPSAGIDPFYRERLYSLEPDGALAGYAELLEALRERAAAGICTWTMRGRSHLGALEAGRERLRLHVLRHADEVIGAGALGLREIPVTERELRIGRELVRQMSAGFLPERYSDEHRERLLNMIAKKTRGEKVAVMRPKKTAPTSPDRLLEVLQASLAKVS